MFLVYDKTGRSAKPYKLTKAHIRDNWELDEEDEYGTSLQDFIDDPSEFDSWETNWVKIIYVE